jgi:glutathione S-transferase
MSSPVLYSFRRCPYAMRARLAVWQAGVRCELREVELRDKPPSLLEYSMKATVPVLVLSDGTVIDESLEVMHWALQSADPDQWLTPLAGSVEQMRTLIEVNDNDFKAHLDRYKYPSRYSDVNPLYHRTEAERFLAELDARIGANSYLFGTLPSFADFAVVPFIRQFANIDRAWFDQTRYVALQDWLERVLNSLLFRSVMAKYPKWHAGDEPIFVP